MKKFISGFLLTTLLILMPSVFAEAVGGNGYTYTISDMYFSDLSGNPVSEIKGSCLVNVIVTKNAYRPNLDSIIIASYATDGEFIGFSMMRGSTSTGTDTQFATLVRAPEGKTIGKVRAYVWDSISGMTPLSEVSEIEVNTMTGTPEEQEKYIPDYFEICGYISETSRTDSSLGKNEYMISDIACLYDYSDCYTAEQYKSKKERYNAIYEYYGIAYNGDVITDHIRIESDDNLQDYLWKYSKFRIERDKYNNYIVKDITPVEGYTSIVSELSLFDYENCDIYDVVDDGYGYIRSGAFIRLFDSENSIKSTKYKLSEELRLYVNGAYMDAYGDNINKYLFENPVGRIELIDTDADGYYDVMPVEYYGTAQVDDSTSKKIYLSDYYGFSGASITLDTEEEEDLEYHIYLDGEEIDIKDIKKDDILSIKYDVSKGDKISDSLSFEIYVSRDTQEGKFSGKDDEDKEITLGGERYLFAKDYYDVVCNMVMGEEYKVYLDVFGRIFSYRLDLSNVKYAIVDKVITNFLWEDIGVGLYLPDGTYQAIEIQMSRVGMSEDDIYDRIYNDYSHTNDNKRPIEARVVTYKLSDLTGKITSIEFLSSTEGRAEYKSRTQTIGSVRMSDATKIIDACDYVNEAFPTYSDLSVLSLEELTNSAEYTAYGFGTRLDDYEFPVVLITEHSCTEDCSHKTEEEETLISEYAVLDKVTTNALWYNMGVGLYLPDGTYRSVEIDFSRVTFREDDIYDIIYNGVPYANTNKKAIENRVVSYKISSLTGRIVDLNLLVATEGTAEYNAETKAVGSVRMSDETKIIDACDYVNEASPTYSDLSVLSLEELTSSAGYTAYGFGILSDYNKFPFVIITEHLCTEACNHETEEEEKEEVLLSEYAIFDRVKTTSSWENIGAGLYLANGTYRSYEIDFSRVSLVEDEIYNAIYKDDLYANDRKEPVENCVVAYKLSPSTGKIIGLKFLEYTESVGRYDAKNQLMGSFKLSDKTKIIDAIDYCKEKNPSYSDLAITSISSFVHGVEYTAYGFGTKNADDTFPFVVITREDDDYTSATTLAVVTRAMRTAENYDGTEGYELILLYGEEEGIFFVTDGVEVALADGVKRTVDAENNGDILVKGDVIVFQEDGNGDIDAIDLIWRSNAFGDYEDTVSEALTSDYGKNIAIPAEAKTWTTAWEPEDSDLITSIVYGVVVDKADRHFTLAQTCYGEIEHDEGCYRGFYTALNQEVNKGVGVPSNGGTMDIKVNNDTNVYVYDSSLSKNNQFSIGKSLEIIKTNIPESQKLEATDGTIVIPWNNVIDGKTVAEQNTIHLALAKVVDGVATEVFFILGEE